MNIILTGFMGTGKTVVGRELARKLGRIYVDVDRLIEEKEGCLISDIFKTKGERYFRRIETETIKEVCEEEDAVISVGGGAVLKKENLDLLRKKGVIFCLWADPDVIFHRVKDSDKRPLLEGFPNKKKRIKQLLKEREPFYRCADVSIDTSRLEVKEVADKIINLLAPERLWVDLGERGYPVYIGLFIDEAGRLAKEKGAGKKVAIISDTNVYPLYGEKVKASFEREGFNTDFFLLPPGERAKSLYQVKKIYSFCLEKALDRNCSIVALGGGVVGDIAGFAASTFLRGINFFMLPTTLLSQVDSSVGGKVGVNLPQGKNLVGSFYQPGFVIIDPFVLRSLSPRRIREGLAEAIKCAIIENGDFFSYLEENIHRALRKEIEVLKEVAKRAVRVKIKIVEEDEKEEKGIRQVLNFGHTIAHAIETVSGYGRYTHGEAVAIGMVGEAKIAAKMGIFPWEFFFRMENLLRKANLPVRAKGLDPEKILITLRVDKKVRDDKIYFVLPEKIGRVFLHQDIPFSILKKTVMEIVQ